MTRDEPEPFGAVSATPPVAGAMNGERSKNNSLRAGRSDGMMTG